MISICEKRWTKYALNTTQIICFCVPCMVSCRAIPSPNGSALDARFCVCTVVRSYSQTIKQEANMDIHCCIFFLNTNDYKYPFPLTNIPQWNCMCQIF